MKKKIVRMMGVGALSASLLTLSPAFAEAAEKSQAIGAKQTASHGPASYGKKHRMKFMMKSLNLNQDQITKIKQIRQDMRGQMKAYWSQMQDIRTKMHSLINSEEYTQNKAKALIAEKTGVLEKLMLLRADTAHKIWLVLDSAQQTKWQNIKVDHHKPHVKAKTY